MRRTGSMIAVLMLLCAASGCGTLLNIGGSERFEFDTRNSDGAAVVPPPPFEPKFQRPPFPFGGVANNVAWIKTAGEPLDVILSLMDIPFSFVADVVTLPWTTYHWLNVPPPRVKAGD